MKWSKYNYLFEENGLYYIYSSLSNSFAEVDIKTYRLFKSFSSKPDFNDCSLNSNDISILKKAKILVDDDREELLRIRYNTLYNRFDKSFLGLTINPTLDCNFNCPYCFEGNNKRSVYMDDVVEGNVIEFIQNKSNSVEGISITWFGGEPLLAFDKMVSITNKVKKLNKPYGAKLITNGYLISIEKAKLFNELSIHTVQVTIDGLKETHNKKRMLIDGTETFDVIIENILVLLEYTSCYIVVRVNIDEDNKHEYIKVCNFFSKNFEKKYFSRISVVPGFIDDDNSCNTDTCLLDREKRSVFLMEIYEKYGVFEFTDFYPSNNRYECAARNINNFTIGPRGELYKCWNDVGDETKIVGILGQKIDAGRDNTTLLKYLAAADPLDDPKCKSCFLFPVCGGGCPYQRIKNEYESTKIDTCDLMKGRIDDFLKLNLKIRELNSCNE